MKKEKQKKLIPIVLMGILLIGCSLFLFYRQAVKYEGHYWSDSPAHIRFAFSGDVYSVISLLIVAISRMMDVGLGMAILECVNLVATWIVAALFIKRYYKSVSAPFAVSFLLLFLASITVPFLTSKLAAGYYNNAIVTQPWHNITYIGMRLFAVIYVLAFYDVFPRYLDSFSGKDWLRLALPLAVSALVKPNFLISVCFVLLGFLVYDAFRRKWEWKSLKRIILMGTTVFPSLIILLVQSFLLYGDATEEAASSGIAVVLNSGFFEQGIKGAILGAVKILRSVALPAIVAIYNRKKMNRNHLFYILLMVVSIMLCVHLAETGPRAGHGNFEWGMMNSGYLLFLVFIPMLYENMKDILASGDKERKKFWYCIICSMLTIGHFLSGIVYFIRLMCGRGPFI